MLTRGGGLEHLPAGYRLVEQYVIQSVLGSGGFGIAYSALDTALDHVVAIKEYFPRTIVKRGEGQRVCLAAPVSSRETAGASVPLQVDREFTAIRNLPPNQEAAVFEWGRQRFVNEAQALARLRHPAIPQVFRVFEANGTSYIAYEILNGVTLDTYVARLGGLPTQARSDSLVEPLLGALAVLHEAGIVHRDVSPHNVLVRADGTPALLDFGSASGLRGSDRDSHEFVVVTEPYSPPELYQSPAQVGPPADIYALAATVYETLAGRRVPSAIERLRHDSYERLSVLLSPEQYRLEFLRGIDWGLSLEVSQRPQSVAEWEASLFPWKNLSNRHALNRRRGKKIFLSYRRFDSGPQAQAIYDFMARQFGAGDVFFDVDSIPIGVDFRDHIRGSILESAVVVALIGPGWDDMLRRRSRPLRGRQHDDFVRVELELAIENGVPIIPVLVAGASMPAPESLPRSLASLSYTNASVVRMGSDRDEELARVAAAVRQFRD